MEVILFFLWVFFKGGMGRYSVCGLMVNVNCALNECIIKIINESDLFFVRFACLENEAKATSEKI